MEKPVETTHEPAMIVTESLPMATDNLDTLLPCSPSQLMNTTTAIETLAKVDEHETSRKTEAHRVKTISTI